MLLFRFFIEFILHCLLKSVATMFLSERSLMVSHFHYQMLLQYVAFSNQIISLSENTSRRISSRLKSGGIHCLRNKTKWKKYSIIWILSYGRSRGTSGGLDEDDVVPAIVPVRLGVDDRVFLLLKTRLKNEFIFESCLICRYVLTRKRNRTKI